MMTLQTAEEFILFCNRTFKDVKTIVFFGGEPLLNLPVMTYICTTFKELHAKGKIQFLPEFGMITNGTMTNNDIIEFINKHLSFVTVSIDGNKELNDANRIFKNGKGSYDKIAQFIHAIQENTTTSIRYEATYTQYHIEKGYTQNKVADIIEKKFGIEGEVIEEMSVQSNCTKDYWNNYTFESWKEKGCSYFPEGFWSIMKALSLKKPKTMCGIARNIFAVSTDGSIYPCHINTGIKGSFLGNIQGKNIFNDMKYRDIHFPVNIEKNETCQTCWANTICGGCSRTWFYQEEKEKFMEHPKETLCKQNKIHLERILLMIAQIKQDRKTWEQLSTRQKI